MGLPVRMRELQSDLVRDAQHPLLARVVLLDQKDLVNTAFK